VSEHEQQGEPTQITLGMSRAEAYDFLRRLAEDDRFRAELESNPAAVFERYNIAVSFPAEERLTEQITLPDKAVARGVFAQISGEGDPESFTSTGLGYGYATFAVIFRVAFAMPLMPPDRARAGHGAG
jgi:hypothetical protein